MLVHAPWVAEKICCANKSRAERDVFINKTENLKNNKQNYLKNSLHSLVEEKVQNVKNEEKREFCCEECEKPLGRVHVILDTVIHQMIPQFR